MKQTTFAQRLTAALVALCMVLSVCAPALAAEPEIGSAAMITLTKDGTTTGLTPGNVAEVLPKCTMSVNGSKVTLDLRNNKDGNLLSDAVLTAANPGTDLELVCGYEYVTAIANPVVITGMHDITLSGYGMAGSLKIEKCNGKVSLTAQHNRAVLGSLNIDNTAGTGGVTITGSHLYPLCNDAGGNTEIASNGPVKIENTLALLAGGETLVGPAVRGSLIVTQSSSVEVTGASGNDATIIGNADITSDGAVTITNAQGTAVGGKLTVNAGGAVTVTGDTVDAKKAAIAKGANITAGGSVNISNPDGIAVDGGLTVNNTSGDVTVTSKGEYALKGITTITSNGAVNITSNGGQVSNEKLTVNKSSGVTVTAVSDDKEAFLWGSNYTKAPRFANTPKVEIWNKGNEGWVGMVEYVPPDGMGSVYYTSSASKAEKHYARNTDDKYNAREAYFRIESAALYTLLTQPEGVTATTGSTTDTKFYAGETVTVTAPADTATKKFDGWTRGGTNPSDLPTNWKTTNPLTFTMPEGNVRLDASYRDTTKYKVTVTGGIIVEPSVSDKHTGSFESGTKVTVAFADRGTEQFEKWTGGENIIGLPRGWQNRKEFTFKMPAGNVTLTAKCKTVYNVSVDDGKGTILVNGVAGNSALAGDQITVTETGSNEHHLFSSWQLTSSTALVEPSENWENSKTFTFKMPAGNVTLKADYKQLYDLTVTGGTIVGGNGDPGKTSGIYLPGTKVTVVFDDSHDIAKQFKQWKSTDTEPEAPDGGWTAANDSTSKTFTFKMPAGDVTLEAEYKTVYNVSVDENRGTVLVNGEKRTQALEGETVTVKASDTFFNAYHQFNGWSLSDDSAQMVEPSENWKTSKTFTFKMPAGNVALTADYKQLYDLTVKGGTIVDENEPGKTSGIYLPGTEVTIQFTESDEITEQFKQWTGGENITEADPNWQNSKKFTFKMPTGNVSLSAAYLQTYLLYEKAGKAEFFVKGQQVHQAPAGVRVTVKLVDDFINDHREFDQWQPGIGTALEEPEEGWEHKPIFRFTMPEGDVELLVFSTTLYDLTVNGGTIVDETSETGTSQKIVKPGQLVTVRAESTEENPFLRWNSTSEAPVEPDDGWPDGDWQTSPEFTFKMPEGNVTLEAQRDQLYKVSINDSLGIVTINGEQRSSLWVKEGEPVTVATTLKDGYWMEFKQWTAQDGSATPVEPSDNWQTSTTFTFKMPNGPVELVAQWLASSLDPDQPIDPDEPLDEDFGVEPAPMDTTGGTIAAVAVGGAAIWGGYEIATRVILHSLLPEGTVIPASRGQLALLVWNTAGRPEPAGAPAFADVTDPDMAKAAQWCTEQGTMGAKGDRFEPEGWTPKFKVIEVWNKAFPAA